MKKFLLSFVLLFGLLSVRAQVILNVENPMSLEGNLDFTWADPAGGWGSPDLNIPANAVTGTLGFAYDDGNSTTTLCTTGSADSLLCGAAINNVSGKIAVLYRGCCQFADKALAAQNAGAIAVIIINNIPGSPVAMGAGNQGANVTIPVAMITDADGAMLRSEILAGNVTVFLGSKTNFYMDDAGIYAKDVVQADRFSNPAVIAQNASEFSVTPGAWVFNFGQNNQNNVSLNATIEFGGSSIYNQTVAAGATLNSGDSVFIALPTFSQPSYASGYYTMTYTVDLGTTDEFASDNTFETGFVISDSLLGYATADTGTLAPQTSAAYRPTGTITTFQTCVHFQDPNASRLGVDGLWVSAAAGGEDSLTNKYIETVVFEWQDQFVDLDDPNFAVNSLIDLEYGDYTYTSNLENELVYVPFASQVTLQDNVRYLFCLSTFDETVYLGYNTDIDYDEVNLQDRQPISPIFIDGTFYALGFGTDVVPTITPRVFPVAELSVNDQEGEADIVPFPNPAVESITIPLNGYEDAEAIDVFDMTGKHIMSVPAAFMGAKLKVDVSNLAGGQYVFKMVTSEGNSTSFNVVVAR